MNNNMIGEKIRTLIKDRGIKQIILCKAMNLSPSRLSNYLSGSREPDLDTLSRIAAYFEVSLDHFSTIKQTVPEQDEKTKASNYAVFLSAIDKPVMVDIITDHGVKKFSIPGIQVSKLITEYACAL